VSPVAAAVPRGAVEHAALSLDRPADAPGRRCGVCDRPLAGGEMRCRNPLCASAARWFRRSLAVAPRGGPLEDALNAYKYGGARGWAGVFGHLLAGFLQSHRRLLESCDLVISSPTFVGRGGRDFDHTRAILLETAGRLPAAISVAFDTGPHPAVVKTGPTPRLAGLGHRQRRHVAEELLRPVLRVPDPGRTSGRRLLVIDDVFTDGRTLDEVARALRLQGGAREVSGLAICRQPWRPTPSCDSPPPE